MKQVACILTLLLAGSVHAQPAEPMEPSEPAPEAQRFLPPLRGTEIFGHILQHHALRPLPSIDAAVNALPSKTLLVVFGNPMTLADLNTKLPGGIPGFLRKGGAILIASDWRAGRPDTLFPKEWNVHVSGQEVSIVDAGDGNVPLTGKPECPVVTDGLAPALRRFLFPHPIFADLRRGLLTNNPSYLIAKGSSLFTLARFSEGTRGRTPLRLNALEPDQNAARLPYIMGSSIASPPSGRVLLIAGHGVFINSTMMQRDYDNIAFADNAIRWLSEGPNGPRDNVLFVEDHRVITSLGLPLIGSAPKTPPMPQVSPEKIINRLIDAVQKDRIVQRIAQEEVGSEALRRNSLIMLTILLVAMGVWRLRDRTPRDAVWLTVLLLIFCAASLTASLLSIYFMRPGIVNITALVVSLIAALFLFRHHKSATKRIPPAPTLMGVQQGGRWPDAFRLRLRELEASGNLWEPAQVLVRDWFHRHAGVEPFATPVISPLMVPGGPFRNRGLRNRLDRAWRFLAAAPSPVKLQDFQRLREDLDDLTFALAEGRLVMVAMAA